MKRGLLFLALFLLTIASVSALQLTYDNVQPETLPGGQVSYLLHLINNEDMTLKLTFKSPDLNWLLDQEGFYIMLDPGQKADYTISFKPLTGNKIAPGNYGVHLIVATQLTPVEKLLTARVLSYGEVLDSNFVTTTIIDPRRGSIIKLDVKNNHLVDLNNLNIELTSGQFRFTKTISLSSLQDTVLEFPVKLDPNTLKGDYTANVKVTLGSNVMLDKALPYSVQEYQELKELTLPETGFLLSGETVSYSNAGNTPVQQTVTRVFGWFSYKLTSFDPEPTSVEKSDQGYVAKWDVNVLPQSTIAVKYTVNYRLPIILVILIIIALFVWYIVRQRNSIVVVKRVFTMHSETGSVKIMKVLLNVRNRGGLTVNNLKLVDRVPNSIKAPTQHGALHPTHVKAAPEGTVMIWEIPNLRPGEEKVISYRIEGKVQMLGRMSLPSAVAKYVLLGRGVTARSSSASLHNKKQI